jgi:tRNA A37 threonylcarbamoyladenosine dehydratase
LQKTQAWGTLSTGDADEKQGLVDVTDMKECHTDKIGKPRRETLRQRLAKAQRTVRRYVAPNVSLVDELIAERREAAKHE